MHLAQVLLVEARDECPYETLDSSAMPVRDAKRLRRWVPGIRQLVESV
ncbi:MAG: hypothetical protein AVDCRST_MAG55-792 [uncultured Rubrobacteraceae bacterium]|uniref:Uncharacterized protein n=1 Tax=uncultured Rubrobacteraceae bacterium TaxID=349277 RepID=A0A6J4P0W3_9ACTN|nr:MAG: hypothetical protein AVDCRST_MAG55-792 [uncultured Rubrobacteraceae bacterium]